MSPNPVETPQGNWELVTAGVQFVVGTTYRLRVPGGFLYFSIGQSAFTFVPEARS